MSAGDVRDERETMTAKASPWAAAIPSRPTPFWPVDVRYSSGAD